MSTSINRTAPRTAQTQTARTSQPAPKAKTPPATAAKPSVSKPATTAPATTKPATTAPAATKPATTAQPAPATPKPATPAQPAPATPAAPAPQGAAQPAQPAPANGSGLLGSLGLGNLGGLADRVRDAAMPPLTDAQRTALQNVRAMLEPDKLGGADRTFNYADRDAVVNGLLRDTSGLSAEVQARLRAEGKNFQANQARRGMEGQRGLLPHMARNRIGREAPGQIAGQVTQGLQTAGIDPNTGAQPDRTPRNVTFAEMRQFEANARVLQEMQQRTADRLNMDIAFPNGPSQASIDFVLQGRFGVPPGAVLTPRNRPR